MSIEKAIQRNKDRMDIHPNYFDRLVPPNEEQTKVTEKWILPYAEEIVEDARHLRAQTDKKLLKDGELRKNMRVWDKDYPEGLCQEIRDDVLERMYGGMLDTRYKGLQMVKNFVREGGIIQPFWGIDKGKYFQNAIQMGDSILDVANDTVDPKKEPVVFYPNIAEAPLKRLENFTEFARVMEEYRDCDVYPNIYLPRLAPLFPVLAIRHARKGPIPYADILSLEAETRDLGYTNIHTNHDGHIFGLSSLFLFNSSYSDKRIPEPMLKSFLERMQGMRLAKARPDFFHVSTDPDDAREIFNRFTLLEPEKPVPSEYVRDANEILRMGQLLKHSTLGQIPR